MLNLDAIAFGLAIGLSGAIPLGPVNLIVIRSALKRGLSGGLAAGLGSVAGDGIFAAVAAFGVREIERMILEHAFELQIIGGAVLIAVGVKTARSHFDTSVLDEDDGGMTGRLKAQKFLSTLGLTLVNPAALAYVLGLFATMSGVLQLGSAPYRATLAVAGVMTGSLLWWTLLSVIVSRLRGRLSVTMLDRVNRWSGIAIAAFGFAILLNAAGV